MKPQHVISLAGTWSVYLDPDDVGLEEGWFHTLPDWKANAVQLPGSLTAQGIGDPVSIETEWVGSEFENSFYQDDRYAPYRQEEKFKYPYWLQPERRYVGPAWYVKEVVIPDHWDMKRITLCLERPHWQTKVWLDGVFLGTEESLSTPHRYEFSAEVNPGRKQLVIRVDNRMIHDVGPNAHSMSDHTQGNWNGIVGTLDLTASSAVTVKDVHITGNVLRKSLLLRVTIANTGIKHSQGLLSIASPQLRDPNNGKNITVPVTLSSQEQVVLQEVCIDPDIPLWDEFNPSLIELDVTVKIDSEEAQQEDSFQVTTAMREIRVDQDRMMLNGAPLSLRGTLECCVFPQYGHPAMDRETWEHIFSQVQSFGLNHVRFHSWCPPDIAFTIADERGVYLQVECPLWKNQGSAFTGEPVFDQWLFAESERIVREYGNHPSFIMFSSGNEPSGRMEEFLGLWVQYWRQRDGRRLYTSAAGWPALAENDYHNVPEPRIQAWGEGLSSRINASPPETTYDFSDVCRQFDGVVVSHEIGQWCAFPNFKEIDAYTGPLKPKNFEIFYDFLKLHHMESQADQFLYASGRQQVLCYKEEIEAALRTGNLTGFQLLGLSDFPGQGTALVGVLDAFWNEKGYCTAEEFRSFCGPTVLLAKLPKRFVNTGESLTIEVAVSHFGDLPAGAGELCWTIEGAGGTCWDSGTLGPIDSLSRGLTHIGSMHTVFPDIQEAVRSTLVLSIEGTKIRNSWDIWVFPVDEMIDSEDIFVAHRFDTQVEQHLDAGRSVLLLADPASVDTDVEIGFSSVFWNTAWTGGQAPHTLGLVCDDTHGALSSFPTESHGDWQWWEPVHGSAAMVLDALPKELKPIVQPIDTWFRSHKLALLFEARVGNGKIMVTSMDLVNTLEQRLSARQLRTSIIRYMLSDSFMPEVKLDSADISGLFSSDKKELS